MRRVVAASRGLLLAGLLSGLLAGAALGPGAAAAQAAAGPGTASFHVLGGFHLKRIETTSGKTGTALLVCSSGTFGDGPAKIHGIGGLKDPTAACEQLSAVNGDLTKLNVHPAWLAPMVMAQVHVEAHGTWKGVKVDYVHDFQNDGALARQTGDVFTL